jgi:hypothetical protein
VEEVLALDEDGWREFRGTVRERDKELSAAAVAAGELHYAIRYNSFMGVRSDYFLAEERGSEWFTAAAKPSQQDLANRALAAAAAEFA